MSFCHILSPPGPNIHPSIHSFSHSSQPICAGLRHSSFGVDAVRVTSRRWWVEGGSDLWMGCKCKAKCWYRSNSIITSFFFNPMPCCDIHDESLSSSNWPFCTLLLLISDTTPELMYTFIEQNVRPGPHISLKCSASGSPPPQVCNLIVFIALTF